MQLRTPGQLRGSPLRSIPVEEFARDLMEAGGVPAEFREQFLPYLLPALDPAKNPDYAAIIVRAGQPCTRASVVGNFKELQRRLDAVDEGVEPGEEAEQAKNAILVGALLGQAMTLAEPLEQGPLSVNLEFDENGNAVNVKVADIGRMYPCNRYLETKYPEAHAEVEERRINQAAEASAAAYRTNPTRMVVAADEAVAELTKTTRELASVLERAGPANKEDVPQFIGSVATQLFLAKSVLRAIELAKAGLTSTTSIEAKEASLKQMIEYAEELKARSDAFVEGDAARAEVPAPPVSAISRPQTAPFVYPDMAGYEQAVKYWKNSTPRPVALLPRPTEVTRTNYRDERRTVTTDQLLPTDPGYVKAITAQSARLRRTRRQPRPGGKRRKTRRNRQ